MRPMVPGKVGQVEPQGETQDGPVVSGPKTAVISAPRYPVGPVRPVGIRPPHAESGNSGPAFRPPTPKPPIGIRPEPPSKRLKLVPASKPPMMNSGLPEDWADFLEKAEQWGHNDDRRYDEEFNGYDDGQERWLCEVCTAKNHVRSKDCKMCETPRG